MLLEWRFLLVRGGGERDGHFAFQLTLRCTIWRAVEILDRTRVSRREPETFSTVDVLHFESPSTELYTRFCERLEVTHIFGSSTAPFVVEKLLRDTIPEIVHLPSLIISS